MSLVERLAGDRRADPSEPASDIISFSSPMSEDEEGLYSSCVRA